jgi:hypothetical protein
MDYDLVERIAPSAFDRAIRERQNTRGLFNHDANCVLGCVAAGTLALSSDRIGLHYEISVPPTQLGRDLVVSIERGDVSGSSFGFIATDVFWSQEGTTDVRTILECDLFDVSPVTFPAYESTTTGLAAGRDAKPRRVLDSNRWRSEVDEVDITLALLKIDDDYLALRGDRLAFNR